MKRTGSVAKSSERLRAAAIKARKPQAESGLPARFDKAFQGLLAGKLNLDEVRRELANSLYSSLEPSVAISQVLEEALSSGALTADAHQALVADLQPADGSLPSELTVLDGKLYFNAFVGGVGEELGPLDWDVKSYFMLGGAMHDSAIAAWGIKGWYDYIRPLSAIRGMADNGQSSDPLLPSYSVDGLPLEPGFIELVEVGDPLAGAADEHVGKIKLLAWRGPDYVLNPFVDQAGVDWILAENWWPYQRPSFVTPPFAGYLSGHSTYSRAGAEILTALTGSEYFPGGMSEFQIVANDFLVFEDGPSVDMTLQWATYRDASDQCSLSRIWGGIHPPADDIPGRLIGEQIGNNAFDAAVSYFNGAP